MAEQIIREDFGSVFLDMAAVDLNKKQMLCQEQQILLQGLKFTHSDASVLRFVLRMCVHHNRTDASHPERFRFWYCCARKRLQECSF